MSWVERTMAAALVLLCGGVLTACEGGGPTGREAGPPASGPSAVEEAPVLEEGELVIAERGEKVRGGSGNSADHPTVLSTDDRIVISSTDDVIRVLDRRTRELLWRKDFTEKRKSWSYAGGLCTAPVITPDGASIAVGLEIEIDCARVAVIDLETGAIRSDESLVETRYTDYGVNFYYNISGLAVADGRLWWHGHEELGYVDPGGQPRITLTKQDLGIRPNDGLYSMGVASDDLLVARITRGVAGPREADRWIGVDVADGGLGEILWTTHEDPGSLGRDDLAEPANVEIFDQFEGAPVVAGLEGNRLAVGRFDPTTGKLATAAVIKWRYLSLFEPEYSASWAVDDGVLYAAAGPPRDEQTEVVAIDLDAGEVVWRTDVEPIPGTEEGELPLITRVTQGTDGAVYAIVSDSDIDAAELQRYDPATGEKTGEWDIPAGIDFFDYTPYVIDDMVVLRPHELADPGARSSYLLEVR